MGSPSIDLNSCSSSAGGAPPVIRSGTLPYGAHPKDRNARIQLPPGYRAMPAPAMYGAPVGGYTPPPVPQNGQDAYATPPAEQALNPEPPADTHSDPFRPTAKRVNPATLQSTPKLASKPKVRDSARNSGLVIRGSSSESDVSKTAADDAMNLNSDSGKKDNALVF